MADNDPGNNDVSTIKQDNEQKLNHEITLRSARDTLFSRLFQTVAKMAKNRVFRGAVLFVVILSALAVMVVPKLRYYTLNQFNVKASSTFLVLDTTNRQPIKNVDVSIGGVSARTDIEGRVVLQNLKLGPQTINIKKIAFGSVSKKITIGWGSNKTDDVLMTPTGVQYTFVTKDFLNKSPVVGAEVSYGESSAISDTNGRAVLTVEKITSAEIEVTINSKQYRLEKHILKPEETSEVSILLVNERKHVYVSERSGQPDLYSSYIDGKDKQVLLKASGFERDDQTLAPSPSQNLVAYVSTRGNQKNSDDFLLSNLLLVDTDTNQTTFLATSEQIYVLGWSGDWVVYMQVKSGNSAPSPDRHQLKSYNSSTGDTVVIATANYFNSFVLAGGYVYFAVNGTENSSAAKLAKSRPDSSNVTTLFSGEIWDLTVTNYGKLSFLSGNEWYDYSSDNLAPSKRLTPLSDNSSKRFVDAGRGNHSLWLDVRDGKSNILLHDEQTGNDKIILEKKHADYPLSWLDETTIIYRVVSDSETADYALSTLGGDPVKISDVKNTSSISGTDKYR